MLTTLSGTEEMRRLEGIFLPLLQEMGMSPGRAKKTFDVLSVISEREAARSGTLHLPLNYGDILLEKESSDQSVRRLLEWKREQGVRDEDFRAWWNLPDIERRLKLEYDDCLRFTFFLDRLAEKMTDAEAGDQVKASFPVFGYLVEPRESDGADAPLPAELRGRVNRALPLLRLSALGARRLATRARGCATFNGFLREEIRIGRI